MSTDHSPESEERPEPQRHRRLVPVVSVAAAVLLAGGGGAYWAAGASGGDGKTAGDAANPPRLALDGDALGARGAQRSGDDGPGIAPGEPMGPRALKAAADLPDGPDTAAVHRTDRRVSKEQVEKLAEALKLDGEPRKVDGRWEVKGSGGSKSGSPVLSVNLRAVGPGWTYTDQGARTGRCAAPMPGQEHLRGGGGGKPKPTPPRCLPVPGGGSGKGDPASAGKAKDAVRPALRALGLEDATLDAKKAGGPVRAVTAEPRVEGKVTHGWSSTFLVGKDGRIVHGAGNWGSTDKGAEYPVMSASKTLDELNKARQKGGGGIGHCTVAGTGERAPGLHAIVLSRGSTTPAPPCGPAARGSAKGAKKGPDKVVDAEFGYATHFSNGKPVLVPSWIYEVRMPVGKGTYPVAYPAVEPEFLKPSDSAGSSGDTPPSTSKPGGPGTPEPAEPSKPAPGGGGGIGAGGGGSDSGPRALNSYKADGRTLTLTYWGGVCDTYKAEADESGSKVTIRLTAKPKDPEKKVCVKIAKRMTTKVTLDKELGDRKVVDARDGDAVPRG